MPIDAGQHGYGTRTSSSRAARRTIAPLSPTDAPIERRRLSAVIHRHLGLLRAFDASIEQPRLRWELAGGVDAAIAPRDRSRRGERDASCATAAAAHSSHAASTGARWRPRFSEQRSRSAAWCRMIGRHEREPRPASLRSGLPIASSKAMRHTRHMRPAQRRLIRAVGERDPRPSPFELHQRARVAVPNQRARARQPPRLAAAAQSQIHASSSARVRSHHQLRDRCRSSPSGSGAPMSACADAMRSFSRSSSRVSPVPAATRWKAWTRRRCPMRSTRPMRCSSRIGFHGSSRLMTSRQCWCRLSPSRGGVGREQQPTRIARERRERRRPLGAAEPAVQDERGARELLTHVQQRVAKLREHHRRFGGAPQQPDERQDLRLARRCRGLRGVEAPSAAGVRAPDPIAAVRRPCRRLVVHDQLALRIAERQADLLLRCGLAPPPARRDDAGPIGPATRRSTARACGAPTARATRP